MGFPLRQNPLIRPEAIVLTSSDRRKPFNVHPEPQQLVGPEVCTVGPEVRTVTRPLASRSVRPDASIFFSSRLMMRTSPGRRRLPLIPGRCKAIINYRHRKPGTCAYAGGDLGPYRGLPEPVQADKCGP